MSFGHLQDFSEAADALGALNLSEGWSSLSLRSRHSESGAQDSQLRAERGDPFESSRRSRRANVEEEEEEEYPAHNVSILHKSQSVSQSVIQQAGRLTSRNMQSELSVPLLLLLCPSEQLRPVFEISVCGAFCCMHYTGGGGREQAGGPSTTFDTCFGI